MPALTVAADNPNPAPEKELTRSQRAQKLLIEARGLAKQATNELIEYLQKAEEICMEINSTQSKDLYPAGLRDRCRVVGEFLDKEITQLGSLASK